ncbi:GTP pyrophosphokinase [Shewanella sp. 10N.286.52.C2]|uniref:RelA/SpoT domain-containing protein n=1 Tax=Shewanella sp. 10N.286.52.C2 TaxID=1880838 RepID=UPI000C83FC9D|nr:RelA/SpoT domain-containing protein [Shewanella sp. 10N.286.52.C2]PMG32167.1 GTP pyrophosphokinase [Shewanella sp. 10N.286.52.C2]
MSRIFRTFIIFLLLLTSRNAIAVTVDTKPVKPTYDFRQIVSNDLDSLLALQNTLGAAPQQFSHDLDALFERAPEAQSELSNLVTKISQQNQAYTIIPKIKSYQRAQQKIALKFDGDASYLTDIARATIVTNDVASMMSAYKAIVAHAEVVQVKNRFATPKASGYRDLNLLVKLPQSQMVAEVQLHLNKIAEIKSGPEHHVYEQIQHIELQAQRQHRPVSELELMQIVKLRQTSHKLYHKAWLSYKRQSLAELQAA